MNEIELSNFGSSLSFIIFKVIIVVDYIVGLKI